MPNVQTPVSICNQALGWLGQEFITSLEDNSTAAKLCKANYEPLRDAVLEAHEWTFATTRKRLVPLAGEEAENWHPDTPYQLPTDNVRVLGISPTGEFKESDKGLHWVVEADNLILQKEYEAVYIRYVMQVVDVTKMNFGFTQAVAARIAMDLALPIVQDPNIANGMGQLYAVKLSEAITSDSLQGKSKRMRSDWMRAARQGAGGTVG